jgi:hypothetical protein
VDEQDGDGQQETKADHGRDGNEGRVRNLRRPG